MRETIEKLLTEQGFTKNGDEFVLCQKKVVGQMIINGVAREQTEDINLKFVYIGTASEEVEGQWIENRTHWQFCVNGDIATEVLVSNPKEFMEMFKF